MLMAYDEASQNLIRSGPTVVLLHAGVADRRMWEPQWDALAERFHVVRCDLRGFGDTPLPAERFSFAGDVVALLDELGVNRAALVGSSFGGRVSLEVASAYPDRVDRLVLLCTALRGLTPTPAMVAFGEREDALLAADDRDGYVELNVATWCGPEASEEVRQLVREMQRRCLDVQLAADARPEQPDADEVEVRPESLDVPALVVSGGFDVDYFQQVADHLGATMPRARRVHLPWAGHLPSLERPAELTELLVEALAD